MLIAVRFCVNTAETTVVLSDVLRLQPCAGWNAFKSSNFDVLCVYLAVCARGS